MLHAAAVRRLLDRLCVDLGFCLSPPEVEGLANNPPQTALAFTDRVFRAEGMDPQTVDRRLYRQVRDAVFAAYGEATDP
jgi:hypothetical protein